MLISPVLHRLDLFSDLMLAIGLVFGKSQETKFLYNSLLTPVSSLNPGLPARSCHQKASVLILRLLLTKHIKSMLVIRTLTFHTLKNGNLVMATYDSLFKRDYF